jgi:pyrroline-5-carboxylate reductase
MNISFIGFGSMAKAIVHGLIKEQQHQLSASAPSLTIGVNKDQIHTHHDNKIVIKDAEVVILAVKPAQMDAVLKEITPTLPTKCLLISVAAGLPLSWFATRCSKSQALIRTMPNTPASVGLAATPMIANHHTTSEQKQKAEYIFSTIGFNHWVSNEEDMDTFTALSGSGPAYVFLFIEAMVDAAVALGLDRSISKQFALQTCKGALKLAEKSDLSLSELRSNVTSPGGTTAAALKVLQFNLDKLILSAMVAAKSRAHELGQI